MSLKLLDPSRPLHLNMFYLLREGSKKMRCFLWLLFLLFLAGIIYIAFIKKSEKSEKSEKPEKKQKHSIRKKSGRFRW